MKSPSVVHSLRSVLPCFSLALFIIAATSAHGDGIPVAPDHKSVTVDSFTIPLNKDQVTQVERLRKVTLTKEQLAPLQAIYDKVPHTIAVVSSRYGDCTCDMDIYGIWCRPGKIDIPKDSVQSKKDADAYAAENPPQMEDEEVRPDSDRYESESLILDSAGRIYLDGKGILEAEILAMIDAMYQRKKQDERLNCWINLDAPPPIDNATDTRIRELVDRIEAHCEARTINFWVHGFSK